MHRTVGEFFTSAPGLAVALVTLAASSELKFRRRSADLALSGSVDAQIVVEIVVWTVVVGLVWLGFIRGGARRQRLGPALRLLLVICALGVGSAAWTGGALSLVRSVQFTAMTAITAVLYHRMSDAETLVEFWVSLRRAVIILALAASAGSLFWPGGGSVSGRYQWFEVHPISTAGMLGTALVMGATMVLGTPDRWLRTPGRWLAFGIAMMVMAGLIVATGSRGATAGTLAGLTTVVALSRNRTRRGVAVLALLMVAGVFLLGYGVDAVVAIAVRGQTTAQLLSLTGRTQLFGIAYDLFLESPWLGYGFLSGREIFLERVPWAGEAHNMFVEIAISLGLVGVALYLAVFLFLLRVLVGAVLQRPSTDAGVIVRGAAGLFALIIVAGMVTSGAAGLPGMQWLALLAVAVTADRWHLERRHSPLSTRGRGGRSLGR